MRKVKASFSEYYTYDKLTAFLHEVAEAYPQLVTLESAGKSWEGRDIWAVTLTNKQTGCADHKPALYVEGNIHAGEVTASMTCLYLVDYLTSRYGEDEEVTYMLDTRTFYILPRVNPDGAEKYLTTPYRLRSSVRPYPEEGIQDLPGLHAEDIDGDGRILQMRVRDDARGPWKVSNKDPRLMLPRRPGERGGPFYHLYTEGIIKEYDGASFKVNPSPWGLDLNRNFPSNWSKDNPTGGDYPASEPEVKTIVDFVLAHRNIGMLNSFHTSGGFVFRNPYTYNDDQMDPDDLRATREIAREGYYVTGYPDVKSNNRSTLPEWGYEHLGMIGYTTELWNRLERAGISHDEYAAAKTPEQREELGLKLLAWNDRELAGKGFIAWTEFDHPQLGRVEIGGWDPKFVVQNPPPKLLEQECHKNSLWALRQAAALPQIVLADIKVEQLGSGIYRITACCENHGYLPTYLTNKGKSIKAVKPDRVSLEGEYELLMGEKETEIGFLEGYMNGIGWNKTPESAAQVAWVVKAPPATSLTVTLKSERGGTVKQNITLE